jgi:hypothetical protein
MAVSVEYQTRNLELRVNGMLFPQIILTTYAFEHAVRYGIMVNDQTFGKFEISSNMVVEWKSKGRWFLTSTHEVLDRLLDQREKG